VGRVGENIALERVKYSQEPAEMTDAKIHGPILQSRRPADHSDLILFNKKIRQTKPDFEEEYEVLFSTQS
jgi:hypothetical protein